MIFIHQNRGDQGIVLTYYICPLFCVTIFVLSFNILLACKQKTYNQTYYQTMAPKEDPNFVLIILLFLLKKYLKHF